MSDDRLFVSNNAIGRKWYFINLILLGGIIYGAHWGFTNYVLQNTTTEDYAFIAKFIEYFVYILLGITFLTLIDRRLYDVAGDRRNNKYKNFQSTIILCLFMLIVPFISANTQFKLPVDDVVMQQISYVFLGLFAFLTIVIGLFKGEISNLSYEKYRQKIKYE